MYLYYLIVRYWTNWAPHVPILFNWLRIGTLWLRDRALWWGWILWNIARLYWFEIPLSSALCTPRRASWVVGPALRTSPIPSDGIDLGTSWIFWQLGAWVCILIPMRETDPCLAFWANHWSTLGKFRSATFCWAYRDSSHRFAIDTTMGLPFGIGILVI